MPKLVAHLRVKDGIFFIEKWLAAMTSLADEIVVVDNGSTDGTYEILKAHPKVVEVLRTEGFHEGRDKLLLYEAARRRKPDWNVWLDVDEIFENRLTRSDLEAMMAAPRANIYKFRSFHFKYDLRHFEASLDSLLYQSGYPRHMWREMPSAHFSGDYMHNGGIYGVQGLPRYSKFRVMHIGQLDEFIEYRIQKYKDVMRLDSDPKNQAMYERCLRELQNRNFPVWRWYEYQERPVYVTFQKLFFDVLFVLNGVWKRLSQLWPAHS
jgi:glycosyltransferase involved in cell wall biosynthesis